jgi:hypothetical protein
MAVRTSFTRRLKEFGGSIMAFYHDAIGAGARNNVTNA